MYTIGYSVSDFIIFDFNDVCSLIVRFLYTRNGDITSRYVLNIVLDGVVCWKRVDIRRCNLDGSVFFSIYNEEMRPRFFMFIREFRPLIC